jgi:hypothetical protein
MYPRLREQIECRSSKHFAAQNDACPTIEKRRRDPGSLNVTRRHVAANSFRTLQLCPLSWR